MLVPLSVKGATIPHSIGGAHPVGRPSPPKGKVLLVGFQDQDNLGLRYLKSAVQEAGFTAEIATYRSDPTELIDIARQERPLVIGFSLIFQYMAPDFARVIQALREAQINAHITMGGHYPSFDYAEVLRRIPELDTIIRFEGEHTLNELMRCIADGADWRSIQGIAFRREDEIVATPLRPAVENLDSLPWPFRDDIDYGQHELPTASILGSRGCPWDCSFCSIRPFYEAQGGALRRLRKPASIVQEMASLHRDRQVPVFLFQDDDFLAGGKQARDWASEIARGLIDAGMARKAVFKMSCRSDEIREDCIRQLMEGGLTHIYMGVESGDEQGLKSMSKRIKPEQHILAGQVLKRLGLSFDFGFMLLQPDSTFDMIRNNINFLEEFVGDGWSVASFCRMLPYAGTPMRNSLEAESRLLGTPFEPDYRFLDPKLDLFYDWMLETFHERNFTSRGLCHILKSLLFETSLRLQANEVLTGDDRAYAHHLTAICNGLAVYTLRAGLNHIERTQLEILNQDRAYLTGLTRHEHAEEQALLAKVVDFYWNIRRRRMKTEKENGLSAIGGFDQDWTLAPREPVAAC